MKNPKHLLKKSKRKHITEREQKSEDMDVSPPRIDQDRQEKLNLQKLKKSLQELIDEKEGGGRKKLKTFAI